MSPEWAASRPAPVVRINDLPDEVLLEIFSYLPLDDMARSAHVCTKWHILLKREEQLWRRKEWSSGSVGATRRLLAFSGGFPRLRCLRLLYDSEYGIRIAWPEVTVHLYVGTPYRWEPYFRSFDTESLVVSELVAENISSYIECVDTRTLRRICVAEQHLEYRQPRRGSYFTFVPTSPHYSSPLRSYGHAEMVHSSERCYRHDEFGPDGEPVSGRSSVSDASETEGEADSEVCADGCVACPALEVLNVHCKRLSQQRLSELCALGPLRVLRIESRGLRDLWLLRGLGPRLEELVVADCAALDVEDFSELHRLVRLRTLRLGKCRLGESVLRDLTADLPHLSTLSLNGRELLACNR
ncbi:uncharacterized protein LOC126426908 [Schistocerca serialis cubense]|uniref:uncharacterized protein LOC126426908 n=1 Tax=Schistocerca serialis cubense TaxID=2023355 RepID=UPI00214E81B4|nr:uncharacterized protein LOC126426908 [Schistocerca serialis cubense]XP_049944969.1 uncharacterized protein LOC126426908 [Schistocerca serialis cubense]